MRSTATTNLRAAVAAACLITFQAWPVHSQEDGCRTQAQIYVQLESYGYRQIQFAGETGGRLQATAADHEGNVSALTLDSCSGEVIQVKKQPRP